MLRFALRLLAAASLILASIGVSPVAAGGGCHNEEGVVHTEGDATVVRMGQCSFSPTVVHVPTGTQVRFLNTASVDHMVVGEAQGWGTEDVLIPGKELARTFGAKGVYPYSCPLHPGMVGAIVVGGADAAAILPVAGPAGDSAPGGNSAPGAAQAAAAEPVRASTAGQAGPSTAELVVVAAGLAAAVIVVVLMWRRQAARPAPSHEA